MPSDAPIWSWHLTAWEKRSRVNPNGSAPAAPMAPEAMKNSALTAEDVGAAKCRDGSLRAEWACHLLESMVLFVTGDEVCA